ncbi:MAG: DUF3426 domain-containing protein [Rhodocyclaceae bacterium]|nr:DUF3426 domain-containing protein [Rhodocyclaceae bacterium]
MTHARCPACHTLFRVTAEQLEARGGRVRCGQCANVFNAPEAPLEPEAAEYPAPESAHPSSAESAPHSPAEADPEFLPAVLVSNRREAEPAPLYQEIPIQIADAEGRQEPVIGSEMPELVAPTAVDWRDEDPPAEGEPAPALPAPAGDGTSRLWGVALGLLMIGAALQSVWVFRSDLSMAYPELRPQFVAWCQGLGCGMPLPRVAGQIGIEASELRPSSQGQGLLKLSATLRNRAAFSQAYPDLELTLTDTDDKPLVRRVFTPKEFLGAKTDPAAGFPANGDLAVSLTLDTSSISAAGYRLYVFYP